MSRKLGHPAPRALAGLRSGLPGSRRGRRLCAHIARCAACARVCAQLDAVSATLEDVSCAPLPAAVEHRVVLALTAEATLRQADPCAGRRYPLLPLIVAPALTGALAVSGCLISMAQTSSVSPRPAARPPAARSTGRAQPSPVAHRAEPRDSADGAQRTAFVVTDSKTAYEKATLGTQVVGSGDVGTGGPGPGAGAGPSGGPGAGAGAGGTGPGPTGAAGRGAAVGVRVAPSRALVGCVLHLTGDVPPKFVVRATYQSEPVYVIAVADEAWVVGIGCTASRPALITSVKLGPAR